MSPWILALGGYAIVFEADICDGVSKYFHEHEDQR
jgi:hypothetical protein